MGLNYPETTHPPPLVGGNPSLVPQRLETAGLEHNLI